ncbi:MAG: YdcH family protein [Pseudomonadota bacterium]
MAHTPHELAADFPEYVDTIHRLKTENAHFRKVSEQYHTLNRDIHRAETEVEPVSDETLEEMKTQRVRLKDEVYEMLKTAS